MEVVKALSDALGLKVRFRQESTYVSLVQSVGDGSADMCISQPAIALQRYRMGLDFFVTTSRKTAFAQRHPVSIDSVYTLALPFGFSVWMALLGTVLCIGVLLAFLNR